MRREKVLQLLFLILFNKFVLRFLLVTFSNKLMATLSREKIEMILKVVLPKHVVALGYLVIQYYVTKTFNNISSQNVARNVAKTFCSTWLCAAETFCNNPIPQLFDNALLNLFVVPEVWFKSMLFNEI